MEQGCLFPTEAGTPQGGYCLPVLANWVLDGLQQRLESLFRTVREARAAKVHLVRYADDFVITGSSKELLETKVKPAVAKFLRERGLTLPETKTPITHVDEGFDFLGWSARMHRSMLLVDTAFETEHQGVSRQGQTGAQGPAGREPGHGDRYLEPDSSGMGELSPQPNGDPHVHPMRPSHLGCPMALGSPPSPEQRETMNQAAPFSAPERS